MELNQEQLIGKSRSHVVQFNGFALHPSAYYAFIRMQGEAKADGIDLAIASSFRDFRDQLNIFNGKYLGSKPLLNDQGDKLNALELEPWPRIQAILRWSALPGASRHHWGTEMDLYDAARLAPGAKLQLVPEEYAPQGPFGPMTTWLTTHMGRFGFYRPFAQDLGGVAPEPWHLSYAPLAQAAQAALSMKLLQDTLEQAPLEGKPWVLDHLNLVYERFVQAVSPPPAQGLPSAAKSANL